MSRLRKISETEWATITESEDVSELKQSLNKLGKYYESETVQIGELKVNGTISPLYRTFLNVAPIAKGDTIPISIVSTRILDMKGNCVIRYSNNDFVIPFGYNDGNTAFQVYGRGNTLVVGDLKLATITSGTSAMIVIEHT